MNIRRDIDGGSVHFDADKITTYLYERLHEYEFKETGKDEAKTVFLMSRTNYSYDVEVHAGNGVIKFHVMYHRWYKNGGTFNHTEYEVKIGTERETVEHIDRVLETMLSRDIIGKIRRRAVKIRRISERSVESPNGLGK